MKCRRVCDLPANTNFGPLDVQQGEDAPPGAAGPGQAPAMSSSHTAPSPAAAVVVMTVDEFESIRLIDLEGLMQEECAARMNVARTTVQTIYNSARKKLADCLVNGKMLYVQGGSYALCEGEGRCGHGQCTKRRCMQPPCKDEG